jgi:hypothetical protein
MLSCGEKFILIEDIISVEANLVKYFILELSKLIDRIIKTTFFPLLYSIKALTRNAAV